MAIVFSDIMFREKDRSGMTEALGNLCRKYHIRTLKIFGSTLHRSNRPGSDIDLLVEFEPGCTPGLAFARIALELSDLLGSAVDLHTEASLSKYFRHEVVREAELIYDEEE